MGSSDLGNMAQVAAGTLLGAYAIYNATSSSKRKDKSENEKKSSSQSVQSPESFESIAASTSSYEQAKKVYGNLRKPKGGSIGGSSDVSSSSFSTISGNLRSTSRLEKRVERIPKALVSASSSIEEPLELSSVLDIVRQESEKNSDLVFDFTSGAKKNGKVITLENRPGIGSVVLGAICSKEKVKVSTIIPSDALKLNLSTLFEVSDLKLESVWHIACKGVDEETLQLYQDYSQLLPLLNSNFAVLLPTTAEEVIIFSEASHHLAKLMKMPVANCFSGVSALSQRQNLQRTATSFIQNNAKCENLNDALTLVSNAVGKTIKPFEYFGSNDALTVIVVQGIVSKPFLEKLQGFTDIGVLVIKMLRPFSDSMFIETVPVNAQRLCVIDYTSNEVNYLFRDVATSFHTIEGAAQLKKTHKGLVPELYSVCINSKEIIDLDESIVSLIQGSLLSSKPQRKMVLNKDALSSMSHNPGALFSFGFDYEVPEEIAELSLWVKSSSEFPEIDRLTSSFRHVQVTEKVDTIAKLKKIDLRLSNVEDFIGFSSFGVSKADVVIVESGVPVTNEIAKSVRPGGKLVVYDEGSDIDFSSLRNTLSRGNVSLLTTIGSSLVHTAISLVVEDSELGKVNLSALRRSVKPVLTSMNGIRTREQKTVAESPFLGRYQPFVPEEVLEKYVQEIDAEEAEVVPKYTLAWNLMFNDAYKSSSALRPSEHEVDTAIVTKFERLTPTDYSRNIFHIEFDISHTDIKYEIGDALGVFGENDPEKIDNFIKEYELDPNALVKLPSRGNMGSDSVEYTSVRNLLLKKLDILGKVQKKFYVTLSKFAESRYERLKLLHTGTDDAEQFKLGTYETVTYAELLLQYRSCKLSVSDMVRMIPEIKARHYSISSSMKMNPGSVHLLVVAVDWYTPLGKFGEGQCTRYLKNLKIGQKVTVDIQKSVLRLPPNPKQPIVMAGLGTGMAPFRAFIQQRYWLKRSGHEIGPMVLYFGARHKAQEWLYGEELEEYERMGLLRLGLAWSRDQKHKVYIQHKIKDDAEILKDYLKEKQGYFYLCGPTWPVPDVRNAIASGLDEENKGKADDDLDVQVVEEMKEDGRYILEVY